LQTFVVLESQTKEWILEKIEVKTLRIEEDHIGHNSGGLRRAITTSLDDESNQSCNSNSRELS
jgi:hypothetical protein